MLQPEVEKAVVRALCVELEVSEPDVMAASSLRRDVGMDSMSVANVVFAREEDFACELDLEGAKRLDTVGDIALLLQSALESRAN